MCKNDVKKSRFFFQKQSFLMKKQPFLNIFYLNIILLSKFPIKTKLNTIWILCIQNCILGTKIGYVFSTYKYLEKFKLNLFSFHIFMSKTCTFRRICPER